MSLLSACRNRSLHIFLTVGLLGLAAAARGESREGGPDAFGYTWRDSGDDPGPAYDWVDISQTGIFLSMGNNTYAGPLTLNILFPFYGQFYETCYLSANGLITFGSPTSAPTNRCQPDAALPNNLIAFCWDDLNPSLGGSVYYQSDPENQRFVIQYTDVPASCGEPCSFQVILQPGGLVKVQFQTIPAACASAVSVGLEDPTAGSGLSYHCNLEGEALSGGLAVQFAPPTPCDTVECAGEWETEPNEGWNDDNQSWSPIACGDVRCGALHSEGGQTDSDWYRYLHFGGNFTAVLRTADFDGLIRLCAWDEEGGVLTSVNGLPRCYGETLHVTDLAAGTYYLVVEHAGEADLEGEQVYLFSLDCDGHACSDHAPVVCTGAEEVEPNEGWNAVPPNSSYGEIALDGSVCGEVWADGGDRDMDWLHFRLDSPADLFVEIAPDAFDPALFVTQLDPAGEVLVGLDQTSICQPEQAWLTGLPAGDYCVVVGNHDGWNVPAPQRYTCSISVADSADACQSAAQVDVPAEGTIVLERPAPLTRHHGGGGCPGPVASPGLDEVIALHLAEDALELLVTMQGAGEADEVLLLLGDCEAPAASCGTAANAAGAGGGPEILDLAGLPAGDYWLVADYAGEGESAPYSLTFWMGGTDVAGGREPDFTLEPCHPNPFNPATTIAWTQPRAARAVLTIHDLRGALVEELDLGRRGPGRHEWRWEPGRLGSGVYLYTLSAGDQRLSGKALLLK